MGGEIYKVEQEVEHLETFEALINDRKIQPLFNPICGIAGFGLMLQTARAQDSNGMHNRSGGGISEHYQKKWKISVWLQDWKRSLNGSVMKNSNTGILRIIKGVRPSNKKGCDDPERLRTATKIAEKLNPDDQPVWTRLFIVL